jgi:hypothetical protein
MFKRLNPRRAEFAHRVSYELENGSIPESLMILHKCNNTQCVNPRHLYAGTGFDNMRDMVQAERFNLVHAKITPEQVQQIRELHGTISEKELLSRFPVSKTQIHRILKRQTWKHV